MLFSRAVLLVLLVLAGPALAQSQKTIRIIVPFAPGASADGIARAIGNGLGTAMGKPVVIENNTGAGGTLGLQALAKSPTDGDTLGVGATEGGVPGFGCAGGFIGLFAPGNTPEPVVKKISEEVRKILAMPAVQANVRNLTASVAYEDGPTFAANLNAEAAKWKTVLSSLKLSN